MPNRDGLQSELQERIKNRLLDDPEQFKNLIKEAVKEASKEASKEATKEWLSEQFAAFGIWTLKSLAAVIIAGTLYLAVMMKVWTTSK